MKFKLISLLFTIGLLICAISSNSAHAQQMLPGSTAAPPPKNSSSTATTKLHAIKITSPIKGQQLPIGNSLIVTGASSDNAISNCQVSVIANGIKPYQPATATGPGGANDYSKWSFTLAPKYSAIKDGQNKITSKITCSDNPTVGSYYSVNVTGLSAVKQAATSTLSSTPPSPKATTTHDITPPQSPPPPPPKSTLSSTPPSPKATTTTTHDITPSHTPPQSPPPPPPKSTLSSTTTSHNPTTPTSTTAKDNSIKITSPTKGQQLPVNSSLIVTGASSDNAISNCQVSVIANGIKPYQPATATGPGGANDYSKWSIILGPKYTAIKEGENKISSSYICPSNPSLFASDTVNVTGVRSVTQVATTIPPIATGQAHRNYRYCYKHRR